MMTLIEYAASNALDNEQWESLYKRQSYLLREAQLAADVYCQLLSFEDDE